MSAASSVRAFQVKAIEETDKEVRKICFDLFRGVVLDTPVDTGRARGNWQIGYTHITAKIDRRDQGGMAVIGSIMAFIHPGMFNKGNVSIWLSNNLPYIGRLETGYSKEKAPHGMVGINMVRIAGKYGI